MKIINQLKSNRKRAVSPVIAVILLIGLAVAAAAAIFIVVLPLLEPTSSLEIIDGYVLYDSDHTTSMDKGIGYGMGYVNIANVGTGEVDVTNISIYYFDEFENPIRLNSTEAWSMESIKPSDPWTISVTGADLLRIRFILPENNDDNEVAYKITVTPEEGRDLDTTQSDEVDESDMTLSRDRPQITYSRTLGNIRRTYTISPTAVSDNSNEVKNVTYEVFNNSYVVTNTITSSTSWPWQWNTYKDSTKGLDNGSYEMNMTVFDYAGLSKSVDNIPLTIDNDYISPTIGELWLTNPYSENQTAEVGESISFTIEIIDTGTIIASASEVDSAFLYYRIYNSLEEYETVVMYPFGTTNNWTASIPSSFVDSTALEEGIECYVKASDIDANFANSSENLKEIPVDDHFKPDISHIPITEASLGDSYINITTAISDEDQVNESLVILYYRQTDDYGGITTTWNSISATYSGDDYYWLIWSPDITIHGLDYFFNATDRFSGHISYEGTEFSPHHISIPDEQLPVITHTEIATATDAVALSVDCTIFDTDPTFGASGSETGTVTVYYRDYDGGGAFLSTSMSRISGDSSIDSNGETPSTTVWSGTVPASAVEDDGDPRLDYYITALDQTTNLEQDGVPFHITTVLPQGEPNLLYVADSVAVSGSIGEQVVITVENVLGSETYAKIGRLNLTIYKDGGFGTDVPKLNLTDIAGTTVWSDASGVSNNTWITFSTNKTIVEGTTADITLTFENSSDQPYDMHDLTFLLVLEAYNDADSTSTHELTIDLPAGSITLIQKRYMTQDFMLSTTYTLQDTEVKWAIEATQFEWGIRVYVGGTELTTQLEAIVYSGAEGVWLERTATWNCPKTTLDPTDSVTVAIVARAGGSGGPEQTMATFSTGTLGAIELCAATWSINYWIQWKDKRRDNEALFGFGDFFSHDSFVEYFTYITSG